MEKEKSPDQELLNDVAAMRKWDGTALCMSSSSLTIRNSAVPWKLSSANTKRSMTPPIPCYRSGAEKPEDVPAMSKMMSYVMSSMKTINDNSPSCIAEMMIQGSTMGVTKITKRINEYKGHDERVRDVANKLLHTEQVNIEEMKKYL